MSGSGDLDIDSTEAWVRSYVTIFAAVSETGLSSATFRVNPAKYANENSLRHFRKRKITILHSKANLAPAHKRKVHDPSKWVMNFNCVSTILFH